eukprot:gnl/TRDRNA2_/TRDRNA2_42602_c1_seq1.p1 gnl/TRDRNA2_/TRDRNA2_42602_c1~~gnl/TRDRNA2_/TRDRNA2_42602_c1_seq1.p1  ORF type:complete len:148 (-),score=27.15 gnl/TRDRNA2_/TRDRNA2_42602_c1_seq1:173-616(-)
MHGMNVVSLLACIAQAHALDAVELATKHTANPPPSNGNDGGGARQSLRQQVEELQKQRAVSNIATSRSPQTYGQEVGHLVTTNETSTGSDAFRDVVVGGFAQLQTLAAGARSAAILVGVSVCSMFTFAMLRFRRVAMSPIEEPLLDV